MTDQRRDLNWRRATVEQPPEPGDLVRVTYANHPPVYGIWAPDSTGRPLIRITSGAYYRASGDDVVAVELSRLTEEALENAVLHLLREHPDDVPIPLPVVPHPDRLRAAEEEPVTTSLRPDEPERLVYGYGVLPDVSARQVPGSMGEPLVDAARAYLEAHSARERAPFGWELAYTVVNRAYNENADGFAWPEELRGLTREQQQAVLHQGWLTMWAVFLALDITPPPISAQSGDRVLVRMPGTVTSAYTDPSPTVRVQLDEDVAMHELDLDGQRTGNVVTFTHPDTLMHAKKKEDR